MKIAVVNASHYGMKPSDRIYNLAVHKIANYHRLRGDEVYAGRWEPMLREFASVGGKADKYYFSAIFTWDLIGMIEAVNHVRNWGKEVEIGGPAATFMHTYIHTQTGLYPHAGLDPRFEHIPGDYLLTFSSRGCPHSCPFCGVKKVEPDAIEYESYPLAPMVGDNNILATSWEHQLHFVKEFVNYGREIDINSGFDIRFFQERHFDLYSRLRLTCWRFAFDTLDVWADVWRVATMMRHHDLDRHQVTFYVLFGFPGTTPEECLFRFNTIIDLGMNPYPQRYTPLNSLSHKYVAPGWTEELLFRLQTYYQSPNIWKSCTFEEFIPGKTVMNVPSEQLTLGDENAYARR